MVELPKHFCSKPFNYVHTNTSGRWKPCCKSPGVPDSKDITFDEWWFEHEYLNGLREEFLTEPGEKIAEHCKGCFGSEARGTKSYRQYQTEKDIAEGSVLQAVENFKNVNYPMANARFITLKPKGFGNLCNLACYMCAFTVSSTRRTEGLKLTDDSLESFGMTEKKLRANKNHMVQTIAAEEMLKIARHYGAFIRSINLSGGEPTMIPGLLKMLDILVETGQSKGIILFMNSNLTKAATLENKFMDYVDKFGKVIIQGSIDHVGKKDEWIRYPSKFEDVIEAAKYLDALPNVDFSVNVTWSLLNIEDADDIVDTIKSNGLVLAPSTNFVHNPSMLHVSNHPHKDKLDIKFTPVLSELNKPFNELLFHQACAYIKDLDRVRGTNAKELWSWIK